LATLNFDIESSKGEFKLAQSNCREACEHKRHIEKETFVNSKIFENVQLQLEIALCSLIKDVTNQRLASNVVALLSLIQMSIIESQEIGKEKKYRDLWVVLYAEFEKSSKNTLSVHEVSIKILQNNLSNVFKFSEYMIKKMETLM